MTDHQEAERPPLHMRVFRAVGLTVMNMNMVAKYGRARPGETWACLCGSLLGRGFLWPLWKVKGRDTGGASVSPAPPA
jgi:hypothetical protein